MKNFIWLGILLFVIIGTAGCKRQTLDLDNPDVDLFVSMLKRGTYDLKNQSGVPVFPRFTEKDIPKLLKHASDLSDIPSFPTIYNANGAKIRLGECMLWMVESIRLGMPASQGCHMVREDAENYEAVFFLTDEEVLKAVERYEEWWKEAEQADPFFSLDPHYVNPLRNSGFRWW